MANNTIRVTGLRELGLAMKELNADIAQKIAFAATLAAANVVKKAAKEKAPIADEDYIARGREVVKTGKGRRRSSELVEGAVKVQSGNIPKNIITKRLSRSRLTAQYIVAVRGGKKNGYASRAASFVEFGTVKMPARPFLRPAIEDNVQTATSAMAKRLKQRIEKVTPR